MSLEQIALMRKYRLTAWLYDILDYPWERQYRRWRPRLVGDVTGRALEAGVGTGHNLAHYPGGADVTGFDLSEAMLRFARRRAALARCPVTLIQADATDLSRFADNSFDWYLSTFMYCVMPDELQPQALAEMARVLRPGGRFRLVEIQYSADPKIRRRQQFLAPFVSAVYGARFDRHTLELLRQMKSVAVERVSYLKDDTNLLIEGKKQA